MCDRSKRSLTSPLLCVFLWPGAECGCTARSTLLYVLSSAVGVLLLLLLLLAAVHVSWAFADVRVVALHWWEGGGERERERKPIYNTTATQNCVVAATRHLRVESVPSASSPDHRKNHTTGCSQLCFQQKELIRGKRRSIPFYFYVPLFLVCNRRFLTATAKRKKKKREREEEENKWLGSEELQHLREKHNGFLAF